jgi:hypothetical protein
MRGMMNKNDAFSGSTNVPKLRSSYTGRIRALVRTALRHFAEGNKDDAELASYEAGRLRMVAGMAAPDSIITNELLSHAFEAGAKDCKQDSEDDYIDFEEAEEYLESTRERINALSEGASGTLEEWNALDAERQSRLLEEFEAANMRGNADELYFYGVLMEQHLANYHGD